MMDSAEYPVHGTKFLVLDVELWNEPLPANSYGLRGLFQVHRVDLQRPWADQRLGLAAVRGRLYEHGLNLHDVGVTAPADAWSEETKRVPECVLKVYLQRLIRAGHEAASRHQVRVCCRSSRAGLSVIGRHRSRGAGNYGQPGESWIANARRSDDGLRRRRLRAGQRQQRLQIRCQRHEPFIEHDRSRLGFNTVHEDAHQQPRVSRRDQARGRGRGNGCRGNPAYLRNVNKQVIIRRRILDAGAKDRVPFAIIRR